MLDFTVRRELDELKKAIDEAKDEDRSDLVKHYTSAVKLILKTEGPGASVYWLKADPNRQGTLRELRDRTSSFGTIAQ